ncbi:MAG: GNAT family N-acetyltransferase [Tumebacillaceae bacterium]
MHQLTLTPITEDSLPIALNIINSNPEYNQLENGQKSRTLDEIRADLLNDKTESLLIHAEDEPIGVLVFLMENPADGYPWLGLLIIDSGAKRKGFGKTAYQQYEQLMRDRGVTAVRLGVLQENHGARTFWEALGFVYYTTKRAGENEVNCFEKQL